MVVVAKGGPKPHLIVQDIMAEDAPEKALPFFFPKAAYEQVKADKVLYAGYFPAGLTLERIFGDLPDVPFRDSVWPKFLRENALRVLKI